MATTRLSPVYDEFLDYLIEKATPAEILAYRPSSSAQQRADYLTQRNKLGEMSPEEAAELQNMLEIDVLISALKARALRIQHQQ